MIRHRGAEGSLPVPAAEAIEILTLLAADPQPDLREKALETLRKWDRAEVRKVLASSGTPPGVLQSGAEHLAAGDEELTKTLLSNPALPAEARHLLQPQPASPPPATEPPGEDPPKPLPPPPLAETDTESSTQPHRAPAAHLVNEQSALEILTRVVAGEKIEDVTGGPVYTPPEVIKRDDELTDDDRLTLIQKVNRMNVVQKIKAALTGNLETRALLVRDSNKVISRAVAQSPKVSDTEAETYAAAKNVSEDVLRLLAGNRRFMKAYPVMKALVNNPRAPIDVTIPLVRRMNGRDLKELSQNHNIPDVIRNLAQKVIREKEEGSRAKLPWQK